MIIPAEEKKIEATSASAPAHPHVLVRWFVQYVTSVPLIFVLVKRAGWSALPALAAVHVGWTWLAGLDVQPHGAGQWGVVLLAAGFALLPLGVVAHRRLSRMLDEAADEAPDASAINAINARSTSAAVPLS